MAIGADLESALGIDILKGGGGAIRPAATDVNPYKLGHKNMYLARAVQRRVRLRRVVTE